MGAFSTGRAAAVLVGIGLAFALLVGRVAYLQTVGRQQTFGRVDRQQHQRSVVRARPGSVYDRNGIEIAGTVQTQAVFVDPKFMQEVYQQDHHSLVEMDQAVARLARAIGKEPYELSQMLSDRNRSRFVKVAEHLDDATVARVHALNLPGVGVSPSNVRSYPLGSLAAHVVGGSGKDGHGLDGLELKFDKLLSGRDGYVRATKDAAHRPVSIAAEDYLPAQHGRHLMLTIDATIQMYAEEELAATCRRVRAKRGEVVVMDPQTGEILALANYPTFNLQDHDVPPELRRNNVLVSPYEPGSTIKPFIAGPALDWRITRLDEVWPIPGMHYHAPDGRNVSDVHAYGPLATWDVLVKSSNIGMCMISERMGNARLHRALSEWGFGRPTGIELPGEDPGRLKPLKKWIPYSTESVAQGYELMVTPLQLCRAFCAYGNGGRLVTPTIVRGTLDAGGKVISRNKPTQIDLTPQVLDPVTAAEMKRILCDVVIRGTAAASGKNPGGRSETWNLFGKTGTAHISLGRQGYSPDQYNSSFLCGAPAEDPRLVVAFIVHEPDKSIDHYGGAVSAPGAKNLIERSLAYLQVPPSPDLPLPPPAVAGVLYHFDAKAYQRKTKLADADVGATPASPALAE